MEWGVALIVIVAPLLDRNLGTTQGMRPVFAQAFIPELPIEAIDKGVLGGDLPRSVQSAWASRHLTRFLTTLDFN
jgi:hypothetical protein